MRFTAVNLPVIVLALAVGAAALPRFSGRIPCQWMLVRHTILFFSSAFNILLLDSSIDLDSEGPSGP
jgi:hypothetical protein